MPPKRAASKKAKQPTEKKPKQVDPDVEQHRFVHEVGQLRASIESRNMKRMRPLLESLQANKHPGGWYKDFTGVLGTLVFDCLQTDYAEGLELLLDYIKDDMWPDMHTSGLATNGALECAKLIVHRLPRDSVEMILKVLLPRSSLINYFMDDMQPVQEFPLGKRQPIPVSEFLERDRRMCDTVEYIFTETSVYSVDVHFGSSSAVVSREMFQCLNDPARIVRIWKTGKVKRELFMQMHPLFEAYIQEAEK